MNQGIKTVFTLGDKEYEVHLKKEDQDSPPQPDATAD